MLIRHAHPDHDAAACASIYGPFVTGTAVSFEEEPPDPAEFAQRIAAISISYPWLVAEANGGVVGYAYASRHRERAAYRWAADVAVYVGDGCRGRGIGKGLYLELLSRLRHQGMRTACAGVTLPNAASVALHESCGFQLVGVYRRIGFKLGRWHDVGWWQLELAPGDEDPPAQPGTPVRQTRAR